MGKYTPVVLLPATQWRLLIGAVYINTIYIQVEDRTTEEPNCDHTRGVSMHDVQYTLYISTCMHII
jgi:hypothetical protein